MKDFQLRNDTRLLFRNDPTADIAGFAAGKRVLFVYGGGSVKGNGCYEDVKHAVAHGGGTLYEAGGSSREKSVIERNLRMVKAHDIQLVIAAGGASVMDCGKLTAFGACHTSDWWDYVKGRKNPYGQEKLPLILMPTYPSSGSEYGLGAVSANGETGDFGTAYGIPTDVAILAPKYSMSLGGEMTAYTGLVTLVQLSASTLGDRNPVSYDMGISVIKNVLTAARKLKEDPKDANARGVILYGASISTSGRLGLGKEENFAYDLYELEFIPEVLFHVPYRKSLTTLFPRFLKAMAKYHEGEIRRYLRDAFGWEGSVEESADQLTALFEELGVDMYFTGTATEAEICGVPVETSLSRDEVAALVRETLR